MKHIIKTFGLLMAVVMSTGAFAATSRASVRNQAASRLPSIAGHIVAGNVAGTTTTTTGSSTASYLDNSECIEKYTDCIKSSDACGADFEECTTNVLFHAQMPKCLSVLYQCQPSGVNALFGTSAINALSDVSSQNSNGEVTRYTYPKSGSVLDQLIVGAGISNQFSTEQCVRNYTRCLNREDICGADFELCTTEKEFKKQAILCASTLARCQSAGKIALFGSVANADSLELSDKKSRLFTMFENGQQLAAMNAVKTCQKVTDNCLINACTKNPLRCVEGISLAAIDQVDIIESGTTVSNRTVQNNPDDPTYSTEVTTKTTVQKLLKSQCLETIGGNQYCHITYREKTPSKKDLVDIDLQEDVFALAYAARKDSVNTRVQELVKKFDTKAKDACYETIKSCAMRSCGGGLGSVCYSLARGIKSGQLSARPTIDSVNINKEPYEDIQSGCAAIVNADANCIYAATASDTDGYSYTYFDETNTTFNRLFPQYDAMGRAAQKDPIGAVGKLNALLATSYNDAAIENMKKQCQTVALSCVKSMCGKDYVNCYRNRTDIVSGTYNTGTKLDSSMNKMGGVLDYNIVIGLCMNNVKSSSVCEEHLKVATAAWREEQDTSSWGVKPNRTVRDAWNDANTTTATEITNSDGVLIACTTPDNADDICIGREEAPTNGDCVGIMDEDGCVYSKEVRQNYTEYALENGAKTLFQTLLRDVEKEAQAMYNAKLTKEQNVCLSNNTGGIMGASNQNGSTFMWVKLHGNKIPKNYAMQGLKENQFTASNDLYGSFCRVRVTIQSDDKAIQDNLGSAATAYFAVGDTFTCGSWIDQKTLDKITEKVAEQARKEAGEGSEKSHWALWGTSAAAALASGIGGYALADAVQKNNGSLGGILSGTSKKTAEKHNKAAESCLTEIDKARKAYYGIANERNNVNAATQFQTALNHAVKARTYARSAGADISGTNLSMGTYEDAINEVITIKGREAEAAIDIYDWDSEDINKVRTTEGNIRSADSTQCGPNCQRILDELRTLEKTVSADNATAILAKLNDAKKECGNSCKPIEIPTQLRIVTKYHRDAVEAVADQTYGQQTGGKRFQDSDAYKTFLTDMNKLETACKNVEDEAGHSKAGLNVAVGAVSAAVGGGITFAAIKAAQRIKYENAANEAVKAWMEEVGDHITCYVGTEEVGTYGDPIALEIN